MKIQVIKEAFLKKLYTVSSVVPMRSTLPILSNVLLETSGNDLKLTATDLDIGMSLVTPVEILLEGAIVIPSKKFLEIIRELPEGLITIWTTKNNFLHIECENCSFKIMGLPKEEFPKLPSFKELETITLNQNMIKDMLTLTSFAVSVDETRYILNGILFVLGTGFLRLVATDGRRLALVDRKIPKEYKKEKSVIVPLKTIQELIKNLKEEGIVKLALSENQALFQLGGLTIISRLIEGEFPNYKQVIPQETKEKVRTNKEKILQAVRRASVFTTPESRSIKIELFKDEMVVSKNSPQIGDFKERLDVEYKGKELLIGFNPAYLLDVLKNIKTEEVELELLGPERPGVIRQDGYVYVVLPMQIG